MQAVLPIRSERLNTRDYEVSSVRKALELLTSLTLAKPVWALSDLARELGIPKSTAHNLLRTLQSFDLIQQDPSDRRYRLGPRALELGIVFSRSTGILAQSRPVLQRLSQSSKETVKLGVLSVDQVLIVAAVESSHQLHTRGDSGTRWPLHSTSLGKAMLSVLPLDEAEALARSRGLQKFTGRTITSWPRLRAEFTLIRERGYALDLEENELGVHCIAAPFVDPLRGTIGAVSVSGPRTRLEEDTLLALAPDVTAAARAIRPHSHLEES
jgi:IclR family KDG regulon transcriptional repressor